MGCFSWMKSDTNESLLIGKSAYLLIPKEFGGGAIREAYYEGYGDFSEFDVYNLVVDWNCTKDEQEAQKKKYNDLYKEGEYMRSEWKRNLGIKIACYDRDNFILKYPIKITKDIMDYEDALPSMSAHEQGCSREKRIPELKLLNMYKASR